MKLDMLKGAVAARNSSVPVILIDGREASIVFEQDSYKLYLRGRNINTEITETNAKLSRLGIKSAGFLDDIFNLSFVKSSNNEVAYYEYQIKKEKKLKRLNDSMELLENMLKEASELLNEATRDGNLAAMKDYTEEFWAIYSVLKLRKRFEGRIINEDE